MLTQTIRVGQEQRLRAAVAANGVDKEARRINGLIVAAAGVFKSERGEFDGKSLAKIRQLMAREKDGLKTRWGHPGEGDNPLFLGRLSSPRIDGDFVRADLTLAESAFNSPQGDLGTYIMDLVATDPAAMGTSLHLLTDFEWRLNKDRTMMRGDDGQPLPPLWRPTRLFASDFVSEGDATPGVLSVQVASVPTLEITDSEPLLAGPSLAAYQAMLSAQAKILGVAIDAA